jgi:hypothetical protein
MARKTIYLNKNLLFFGGNTNPFFEEKPGLLFDRIRFGIIDCIDGLFFGHYA